MSKEKADALMQHAASVLNAPEVSGTIPAGVLSGTCGIAVLRVNKRSIVSTSSTAARGVLVVRTPSGEWSAPAFVKIVHSEFGLLSQVRAGTDIIMLLCSQDAVDVFGDSLDNLTLGDLVRCAPGPLGDGAVATAPVHVYGRSSNGFVLAVDAHGTVLAPMASCNSRYYGIPKMAPVSEILRGTTVAPGLCGPLHRVLRALLPHSPTSVPPAYVPSSPASSANTASLIDFHSDREVPAYVSATDDISASSFSPASPTSNHSNSDGSTPPPRPPTGPTRTMTAMTPAARALTRQYTEPSVSKSSFNPPQYQPPPYTPSPPESSASGYRALRPMQTLPSRSPPAMTSPASSSPPAHIRSASMPQLAPPVPRRPSKEQLMVEARALFDYTSNDPDDLPLKKGQRVKVLYLTPHQEAWWVGQLPGGRTGKFPASYVAVAQGA